MAIRRLDAGVMGTALAVGALLVDGVIVASSRLQKTV